MDKNFSKLQLWINTTVSYLAGVGGGLVILFSLDNNNRLQGNVFWVYLFIVYAFLLLAIFFITKIFRQEK